MTTTDMPPGAADDLPRRRHGRGPASDAPADLTAGPAAGRPGPAAQPTSRRAARLAAAQLESGAGPTIVPTGAPAGGRSAYGAPAGPYQGAPAVGYPQQPTAHPATHASAQPAAHPLTQPPAQGGPFLDLDALTRTGDAGGAGRPGAPGARTVGDLHVGDLQVGPATTPIRRRRPVSLPESFDVATGPDAEPEPEQATMPLRTQTRPPKTGTIRMRGRSARSGDAGQAPAPPPMVSAPPTGAMPFVGVPPTGAISLTEGPATDVLRRVGAAPTPGAPFAPPSRTAPAPVPAPGPAATATGPAPDPERPSPDRPDGGRQPDGSRRPGRSERTDDRAGAAAQPSRRSRRRAADPQDAASSPSLPDAVPGEARRGAPSSDPLLIDPPQPGSPHAGPAGPPAPGVDPGHGATPPRRNRAGRNLPMAIAVGVGLAAVVLASLLIRKEAFVAVVCVAAVLAVWELAGALGAKEITVPVVPLAVGSVGMLVSAFVAGEDGLLVSFALTSFGVLLWRIIDGAQDAARDVAASVFAAAYVPFLAGFTMLMLAAPDGARRIIVFILVVVASDTGGYTAGVLFGKHPMAPTVSPHKSWEGFAGSTVACVLAGSLGVIFLLHGVWYAGVAAGAAAVVTATVGDLSESLLKRDLGIKDMGHLLPGHGGMLDRIDSLLLTAPVVYVLLSLLVPLP